jgi:hypothetical protein
MKRVKGVSGFDNTGTGNEVEVFNTVIDIIRTLLADLGNGIQRLNFSAATSRRKSLYARMAHRLLPNWQLDQYGDYFTLTRPQPKHLAEGDYVDISNNKDIKNRDLWHKRWDDLQSRIDYFVPKLIAAAGPQYAKALQGTKVSVNMTSSYAGSDASDRIAILDITVFWDAPDDALVFSIAHELGHIALAHVGDYTKQTPQLNRQQEFDADDFAVSLAQKLGFNQARVFAFFHSKKQDYDAAVRKAQSATSTHPSYTNRIQRAVNQGFKLSKGGLEQMNVIQQHLAEDWNKVNRHDHTDGLSKGAVSAYRREHPGSHLQTAVTTEPSKLKAGSKAAKRRKSFCARMTGNKGPMARDGKPTPKALALRRWNC